MSYSFEDGSPVALCRKREVVAFATIISTDENDIVHCIPLGSGNVKVRVDSVRSPDLDFSECEKWWEMVGALLAWRKSDLMNVDSVQDSDGTTPPEFPGISVVIPRLDWMGMIVKVIDDNLRVFATATVVHVDIVLEDIQLGDTHLGILFTDFLDGATREHLKYKHSMKSWDMHRLIASDGNSMAFHRAGQEPINRDAASKKRSYVLKSRGKKLPAFSMRRKEIFLTSEHVRMISTKPCCSQKCCQHFDWDLALEIRKLFWEKSFSERKDEEIRAISNALLLTSGEQVVVIQGVAVCLEAWRIIHARGRSQFFSLKKSVSHGVMIPSHGNLGKRRMSERVSQAYMTLKEIVDHSADHHPAKRRTMADNSVKVLRELPKSLTWESIRNKINEVNVDCGLGHVSQSLVSNLHQTFFKEVAIHKKGNNFSKCTECTVLSERKARLTGLKEELEQFRIDEKLHHVEHSEGRLLYHAWRTESIQHPKSYLCIIHDKMDHGKTAIPSFPNCPKSLANYFQFPVTVTGILTHGHGPKAIAQYSAGVWGSGPNPIVGSLDSILRMLENPQPSLDTLLEGPHSTQVFQDLLVGRDEKYATRVRDAFKEDTTFIAKKAESGSISSKGPHRPLPRVLKLQLDNAPGDNKNRYMFAYLSLLTARQVFEEIITGFLIPGHTHEDVDAMFGHFSEALKHNPVYTLPALMDLLMRSRKPNPVPHFVEEVPDFKSYVDPYLLTGGDRLVGHTKPRLFRFYVRHDSMPCMQYKLRTSDEVWLPGEGIEMWSWTDDKRPKLPTGVPKRLPMQEMDSLQLVIKGLRKYVGFFELCERKAKSESAKADWKRLIDYWNAISDTLMLGPVEYRPGDADDLVHGFWPVTKWIDNIPEGYRNVACELEADVDYVGPFRAKPPVAFNPRSDICLGHIVLVRPDTDDLKTYPVFMGKVVSDVREGKVNDDGLLDHVCDVEWYRPFMAAKKRGESSLISRWQNCWTKKWERDAGYPDKETISVMTVLWSYKPSRSPKSGLVSIPKANALKAQDSLSRSIEAEEQLQQQELLDEQDED